MADTDLQQYNGTASFPATADVGTSADPYLEPTDGPIVCANTNGLNQAPVNKALNRVKDLLLGLRDGVFGDRIGAIKKTVQGLRVAIVGGATATTAPGVLEVEGPTGGIGVAVDVDGGDINANTGNVVAQFGNVIAPAGSVAAGDLVFGAKYTYLQEQKLGFIGSGSGTGDANPPGTTPLPNQLRALNIPKAWASFTSNGVAGAGVVVRDSAGISSITKTPAAFIITWATPFTSANYDVLVSISTIGSDANPKFAFVLNKTSNTCDVGTFAFTGSATGAFFDPVTATPPVVIDIVAFGRQTT